MRQLHEVLDRMFETAPDLKDVLASTRQSCVYQPPEMQDELWIRAAYILSTKANNHPKIKQLEAIFRGEETTHVPKPKRTIWVRGRKGDVAEITLKANPDFKEQDIENMNLIEFFEAFWDDHVEIRNQYNQVVLESKKRRGT